MKRQPIPKDWYKSKEAIALFVLIGLMISALLAGLILLTIHHPLPVLYTAAGLAAAATVGFGIYRFMEARKWKRDMKRLDEAADVLRQREREKAGKEE